MVSQHLKGTRASSPGWSMSRVAVTLLPLVSSALALSPRAAPKAARPSVTAGSQSLAGPWDQETARIPAVPILNVNVSSRFRGWSFP